MHWAFEPIELSSQSFYFKALSGMEYNYSDFSWSVVWIWVYHWSLAPATITPSPLPPNGSCLVTYCNIYTVYTVFFLSLDLDGFIKHMLWEEVHEKSSLMQLSDRLLDSTSICVKYSLVEQAEKKHYETYRKIWLFCTTLHLCISTEMDVSCTVFFVQNLKVFKFVFSELKDQE